MPDFDVLVLGEINVDLVLTGDARPVFGQFEKVVEDASVTLGGSGVIFACGAARLGLRTAYCGVVGDDLFGRFMLDGLHQRGIDISGVHIRPDKKTGLTVILHSSGDRALLTHLGAISALSANMVDRALLARARHIHVSTYFLQLELQPGLPGLLAEARRAGATVSIDTNWDPTERWNHGLADALAQTDVFLPNEQEALAIARRSTLDEALGTLGATIPTVAVKRGAEGAICRQCQRTVVDPGFPADVVDATGAGDSFDAGFVYGYTQGWSLEDTLALACACGTLSTRAAGGTQAQATLEEAQQLIGQRRT